MENREPESLIIRPPSEWRSLLVRLTRGCKWNRCRFCGVYPAMGQPGFSCRKISEIKEDIDQLRQRGMEFETAFFGDADPLQLGAKDFVEAAKYLRCVFPEVKRLTCYARASTLWRLGQEKIKQLSEAGLNRVHIGLESGDQETLNYHRKGQNRKVVLESGRWLRESGIEISYYVLLGLGGLKRWREHIDNTAALIEDVNPEFVRIRRIWLYGGEDPEDDGEGPQCPLNKEISSGKFVPQTPEGTVAELRRLLEKLEKTTAYFTCDHINNYVRVKGRLPVDKKRMVEKIDKFLNLDQDERERHYKIIGSRI